MLKYDKFYSFSKGKPLSYTFFSNVVDLLYDKICQKSSWLWFFFPTHKESQSSTKNFEFNDKPYNNFPETDCPFTEPPYYLILIKITTGFPD